MAYDGSRRAGEWARARSQGEWRISGVLILAMTGGIAAFVLAVLLGLGIGLVAPLATASLLAGWLGLKRADVAVPWTKGALSEERVGALLDGLRSDGYLVVHDVEQSGEGNVDHLVAGLNGVFLIETKHRRYEARHLTKVKRQAAKLNRELDVWVTPVLCLDRRERPPFRPSGVWVMSGDHLADWIRAQRGRPVEQATLSELSGRLESPPLTGLPGATPGHHPLRA